MNYKPFSNDLNQMPSLPTLQNVLLPALKICHRLSRVEHARLLMMLSLSLKNKDCRLQTVSTSTTIGKAMAGQTMANSSSAGKPQLGLGKPPITVRLKNKPK